VLNNDVISSPLFRNNTIGIAVTGTNALVVNNRIGEADIGIFFPATAAAKYRDNLTTNVNTPYVGGTDAGNNN
jgi:hypothetical protein